ncbi:translational GTPase TypA [Sesbania bispinosa]|nr:translational GTPase TypA [Sesbania bispinosa]
MLSTDKAGSSRENRKVDRFVAKLTPNEDMVFIENKFWVKFRGNCEFDIRVVNGNLEVNYPRVESDEDVDVQPVEYEEDPEDDPEEPLFLWEVTLTKAAASGANALLIPARIVRDILDKNQEVVTIINEGGELIPCKLLKPKGRPS